MSEDMITTLKKEHDARVKELLAANNREVEARRAATRQTRRTIEIAKSFMTPGIHVFFEKALKDEGIIL